MSINRDIEVALTEALPAEFHPSLPELSLVLAELLDSPGLPDEIRQRLKEPSTIAVLKALVGQQLPLPSGDIIRVGDIQNSKGVAVGEGAIAIGELTIQLASATEKLPPLVIADIQRTLTTKHAQLVRETSNRPGDSPLQHSWSAFLKSEAWHVTVEKAITDLRKSAEVVDGFTSLVADTQKIDLLASYLAIRHQLETFPFERYRSLLRDRLNLIHQQLKTVEVRLERLRKEQLQLASKQITEAESELDQLKTTRQDVYRLREALGDVQDSIANPFNRCFLVLGRIGSGRTHFVREILDTAIHANPATLYTLPLVLDIVTAQATLEQTIVHTISQLTQHPWHDLRAFGRHVEQHFPHAQIVIVIDDLDYWLSARSGFLEELTSLIETLTDVRAYVWCLAANITAYPHLLLKERIWRDYGYAALNTIVIGNWIALDQLNDKEHIGSGLLRYHLQGQQRAYNVTDALLAQRPSYLQSPLIAWLCIDLQSHYEQIETSLWNLNFIQFVERFWELRKQQLLSLAQHTTNTSHVTQRSVDELEHVITTLILQIADYAVQTQSYILEAAPLLQSGSRQPHVTTEMLQTGLRLLTQADLLEMSFEAQPGVLSSSLRQRTRQMLRLYFEPFWDFHLSASLLEQTPYLLQAATDYQMKTAVEAIATPTLLAFILLHLDAEAEQRQDATIAANALQFSTYGWLRGTAFGAALYHAAIWASTKHQAEMIHRIQNPARYERSVEELFAALLFCQDALIDQLTLRDRLALIRSRYRMVADMQLGALVQYLLETALQRTKTSVEILDALREFEGCEVLNITEALADVTIEWLLRRLEEEARLQGNTDLETIYHRLLDHCLDYMAHYAGETRSKPPIPPDQAAYLANGNRWYYHDWFFAAVCQSIVRYQGINAFEIFTSRGWYEDENRRFASWFIGRMRREVHWALGSWYDHTSEYAAQHAFETLVKQLVQSSNRRKREAALFLIRHTQPTGRQQWVRVRAVFHPILEQLLFDPALQRVVTNYFGLFEANLSQAVLDRYLNW